jgi:hypothetical protein
MDIRRVGNSDIQLKNARLSPPSRTEAFLRRLFRLGVDKLARSQSSPPASAGRHGIDVPHEPRPTSSAHERSAAQPISASAADVVMSGNDRTATTTVSTTSSPQSPRTFRLSLIPISIDQNRFKIYLRDLRCRSGTPTENNILAYSLAPYTDWLVATVTFFEEPLVFRECRPQRRLHVWIPPELGVAEIAVDCDFYGITPLNQPRSKPQFEYVEPRHLPHNLSKNSN